MRDDRPRVRVGGRFAGEVSGVELREGGVNVIGIEREARHDPVVGVDLDDVERLDAEFSVEQLAVRRTETGEDEAFALLRDTVERLASSRSGPPHLSGLKTQMRKAQPHFSEKLFGYGGFLQFARAARSRGLIEMEFDEKADDYVLRPATPPGAS